MSLALQVGLAAALTAAVVAGFGIYDHAILPLIAAATGRRLPVKAPVYRRLGRTDRAFMLVNKLAAAAFVYHCFRFAAAELDCSPAPAALLRAAAWLPVHVPLTFVVYDLVYTAFHWALHLPWLYPLVHKHHHRQLVPFRGNADAINVHPAEYVLGEYNHLLAAAAAARLAAAAGAPQLHAAAFVVYVAVAGTLSSLNHTRTDVHVPYLYAVWWHDYHHRQPRCNYGQYIMLWDWVFGTYRPRAVDTAKAVPGVDPAALAG